MNWLLSGDTPRSKPLSIMVVVIFAVLALAPFIFPDRGTLNTAAVVCVFILLAASYDMLLGYTAIISFAHTVFFAVGGYSLALCVKTWGNDWWIMIGGGLLGIILAAILAFAVSLLSLRVKALFFAMVTLVVFVGFASLVVKMSWLTGGEDGVNFKIARALTFPAKHFETSGFNINPFDDEFGVFKLNFRGHMLAYYIVFFVSAISFLTMLRIVNSPFGRILQGIRENEFRMEAIGYKPVVFRVIATVIACSFSALAGVLFAMYYGNVAPSAMLDLPIMINVLLMVVLGGMGTMYGAVVGCTIIIIAERYLKDFLITIVGDVQVPVIGPIIDPHNWPLWLGIVYVLSVYFFAEGIVGKLRLRAIRKQLKATEV